MPQSTIKCLYFKFSSQNIPYYSQESLESDLCPSLNELYLEFCEIRFDFWVGRASSCLLSACDTCQAALFNWFFKNWKGDLRNRSICNETELSDLFANVDQVKFSANKRAQNSIHYLSYLKCIHNFVKQYLKYVKNWPLIAIILLVMFSTNRLVLSWNFRPIRSRLWNNQWDSP